METPPPAPMPTAGVKFDDTDTLTAGLSQSVDVGLTITGADTDVKVWLEGSYLDASLSADSVTSADGRAVVTLHTPSVAATFAIVARINGGAEARLSVSVSADGYGTVRVLSTYPGRRPTPSFRASVSINTTCDDLAKGPISDGALPVDGDTTITIAHIPAGKRVAVSVRLGHYASGCTDVDGLVRDKTRDVPVSVFDVPMALDRTNLDVTFKFAPEPADADAWRAMLDASIGHVTSAFFGGDEGKTLLDDMRATISAASDQAQFDQARASGGWDAKVNDWLKQVSPSKSIQQRAVDWMNLVKSDPIGDLTLQLTSTTKTGGATAALTSFGALTASMAGIWVGSSFAWAADAADTVHLSGSVSFGTTQYIAHAADIHARQEVQQSAGVASALAMKIDCPGLIAYVVGSGAIYGQCSGQCAADACRAAIATAWNVASGTSTNPDTTTIDLTASGPADVGDYAEPLRWSGEWVGHVHAVTGQFGMNGTATGMKH